MKSHKYSNKLFQYFNYLGLVLAFSTDVRAQSYFLDLESGFTSQIAYGHIGEASATISVTGAPGKIFIAPATQTDCSNKTSFSDETAFSPAMKIGDTLAIRKEAEIGNARASVTFTFSKPLTNPSFHFVNVDRTEIEFQAVDGIVLLSGNGDISDGLAVRDNRVFDVDPSTTTNDGTVVFTGERSGAGTVRIYGTYTTISAYLSEVSSLGDLFRIQISAEFEQPKFKITSFEYSSDSGFSELHFVGSPQSLFQIRHSATLNFSNGVILEPSSAYVGLIENGLIRSCSNGKGAVRLFLGKSDQGFVRVEAIE